MAQSRERTQGWNFKQSTGARNRLDIGLSYRPMPGLLKSYKIRALSMFYFSLFSIIKDELNLRARGLKKEKRSLTVTPGQLREQDESHS